MNLAETQDLLRLIAVYDNRRFDDATVIAWHEIFADLDANDARTAVVSHFASNDSYLMPVHVRRGAHELSRERRRLQREAAERDERLALEADPTRYDRTPVRDELVAQLRVELPEGDSDALHRPEVLAWERQRARDERPDAVPNPHYDPAAVAARLAAESA